jgi:hypothetical protein
MPDVQEVFRMATQKVRPEPGFVDRQLEHQRRQSRRRKAGALALVAAIGVVALVWIVGTRAGQDTTMPANPPTTVDPSEETAVDVATAFFYAASFNEEPAVGRLADDADLSGYGVDGTREFRLLMRFWEATGFKHILDSCVETSSYALGTVVRCTYDFHAIRSDEIGMGPYTGSYEDFTVRGGEIVRVRSHLVIAKFSPQMWEPVAEWVSTNYPEDVAVMYKSGFSDYRLTEESIRLWEQHSREYVEAVQQGIA